MKILQECAEGCIQVDLGKKGGCKLNNTFRTFVVTVPNSAGMLQSLLSTVLKCCDARSDLISAIFGTLQNLDCGLWTGLWTGPWTGLFL